MDKKIEALEKQLALAVSIREEAAEHAEAIAVELEAVRIEAVTDEIMEGNDEL